MYNVYNEHISIIPLFVYFRSLHYQKLNICNYALQD